MAASLSPDNQLRRRSMFELSRVGQWLDKLLFAAAFVLGAGSIVGLKALGSPQLVVTAAPVAVMLAYLGAVVGLPRFQLRHDLAGDNLYYLGFLFTLMSLAYALVSFVQGAAATDDLITNFGIALATTIVGLALRVILAQFRQDPVEIEREARLELSDAARRLRAELETVVLDLSSFRRASQQVVAEGFEEMAGRAHQAIAASAENLEAVVTAALKGIGEAHETQAENARKINKQASGFVLSVSRLVKRIDGIDIPADLLSARIEALGRTLDKLAGRIEAVEVRDAAVAERIEPLGRALDALVGRVEAVRVPESLIAERLQPAFDAIDGLAGMLRSHLEADAARQAQQAELLAGMMEGAHRMQDLGDGASTVFGRLDAVLQRMEEGGRILEDAAEKVRAGTEAQLVAGRDALGGLAAELMRVRTLLEQEAKVGQQAVAALAAAAEEQHASVRRHVEGMEAELGRARNAAGRVENTLAEMAETLAERLAARPTTPNGGG